MQNIIENTTVNEAAVIAKRKLSAQFFKKRVLQ